MAIDVTLNTITTGFNLSKINQNFERIEEALADALSRSGNNPNTLSADLDMNGNDILNIDNLSVDTLTVGGLSFDPENVTAIGPPGENATITVGTVSTGAAGTDVEVENVGDEVNAIFNFTIPRGDTGASGAGTGDMIAAQNLNDVASKPTAFNNIKQAATESTTGVVELASEAEGLAQVDTSRAITPAVLGAVIDSELATFGSSVTTEISAAVSKVVGINTVDNGYTFVLTDAGKIVVGFNASLNVDVTIPPNASVAFPIGTFIELVSSGSNGMSVTPGSGVTLLSSGSKRKLTGQFSGATIIKTATNTWLLVGDIKT